MKTMELLNSYLGIDEKKLEKLDRIASNFGEKVLLEDVKWAFTDYEYGNEGLYVGDEIANSVLSRIVDNLCISFDIDEKDFYLDECDMVIYYKNSPIYREYDVELLK